MSLAIAHVARSFQVFIPSEYILLTLFCFFAFLYLRASDPLPGSLMQYSRLIQPLPNTRSSFSRS